MTALEEIKNRKKYKPEPHDIGVLLVILSIQIALWYWVTKPIKPELDVLPPVPSERAVKALSFGDEQFFFRLLAMNLQNAGDTFGRATPLKNYNYETLSRWFSLMDKLDARSNFTPTLAAYYFSQTQNWADVHYIVDYLEKHYDNNPQIPGKWWWLHQAIFNANFRMKDSQRALDIAIKLSKAPGDLPMWARQMPAFFYAKMGEEEAARKIMVDILGGCKRDEKGAIVNCDHLSKGEINFIHYFLKERLKKLDDISKSKKR